MVPRSVISIIKSVSGICAGEIADPAANIGWFS